jgi:hypothetical protein
MMRLGQDNIHDVILFPQLKPKYAERRFPTRRDPGNIPKQAGSEPDAPTPLFVPGLLQANHRFVATAAGGGSSAAGCWDQSRS